MAQLVPCLLETAALPLILQHPIVCEQQELICSLLCTCKTLYEEITVSCIGLVPILFMPRATSAPVVDQSMQFAAWVQRHGSLMRSLHTEVFVASTCIALDAIANRLQKSAGVPAAAQPASHSWVSHHSSPSSDGSDGSSSMGPHSAVGALQLQCYKGNCITLSLLQQLPARSLTSLEIGPLTFLCATAAAAEDGPNTARAALYKLSHLHNLALCGEDADLLLPVVPALSQLTRLQLVKIAVSSVALLSQLPQQLRSLQFSVNPNVHSWQRKQLQPNLAHLTALTELSSTGEGLFAAQATDVLPPQLRNLTVTDCPIPQPLLPLQRLEVLHMTSSTTPAVQLAQLSKMKFLTTVGLGYARDPDVITAAAAGWPLLPLRCLELRVYPGPVTAATVQQLGKLRLLKQLTIQGFDIKLEATPLQLAGVLRQLTALQELKLAYLRLLEEESLVEAEGAVAGSIMIGSNSGTSAADSSSSNAATSNSSGGNSKGQVRDSSTSVAAAAAAVLSGSHCFDNLEGVSTNRGNSASSSSAFTPYSAAAPVNPATSGMALLMHTIARLPLLHTLKLSCLPLGIAAKQLAAASHLTYLALDECELKNDVIAVLGGGLTGLRKLSLNWNFRLTKDVLHVIGGQMQQLKELSLCPWTADDVTVLHEQLPGLKVVF